MHQLQSSRGSLYWGRESAVITMRAILNIHMQPISWELVTTLHVGIPPSSKSSTHERNGWFSPDPKSRAHDKILAVASMRASERWDSRAIK